jgi:hypothetical protein
MVSASKAFHCRVEQRFDVRSVDRIPVTIRITVSPD